MTKKDIEQINNSAIDSLYKKITNYINSAKSNIVQTIDNEQIKTYWLIGKEIVEEEQKGDKSAKYGDYIIKSLSAKLTDKYGTGFSTRTLIDIRKFYIVYQEVSAGEEITHALRAQSELQVFDARLSWTHYRLLTKVSSNEARKFYEIEASENCWSSRELERQISSLLFERLSKSKDKKGLLELAHKGQEIKKPEDAIKDPLILEFLGIPESHQLTESKLEQALINHLQHFLLELGKGFAFIARQKRLTLEGDHFYADLVFYHVILKCYVIIDLKTQKLTHNDLGQMQLYVNYFDKEVKTDTDNPTLGLVLCTAKNDAVVKYTLGDKNNQIFTSKYQFHLPTEEELKHEIEKEVQHIKKEL